MIGVFRVACLSNTTITMIHVEGRSCQSDIQARIQISQGIIARCDNSKNIAFRQYNGDVDTNRKRQFRDEHMQTYVF